MDPIIALLIILLILWAGGFAYGVGSAIHLLLLVVIIVILIRLLQGRAV